MIFRNSTTKTIIAKPISNRLLFSEFSVNSFSIGYNGWGLAQCGLETVKLSTHSEGSWNDTLSQTANQHCAIAPCYGLPFFDIGWTSITILSFEFSIILLLLLKWKFVNLISSFVKIESCLNE